VRKPSEEGGSPLGPLSFATTACCRFTTRVLPALRNAHLSPTHLQAAVRALDTADGGRTGTPAYRSGREATNRQVRHPDAPRFFDPEPAARELAPAEPAITSVKVPVRLGPVRSSSYRRDRIVWRASEVELGLYEDRRWTDLPSHYVERALARELYERRGISRAGAQPAVTLLADVVAFDDVVAPTREAYVAIPVPLVAPDERQLLVREFAARSPIANGDPSVARAMGVALDHCVDQIVSAVETVLSHSR